MTMTDNAKGTEGWYVVEDSAGHESGYPHPVWEVRRERPPMVVATCIEKDDAESIAAAHNASDPTELALLMDVASLVALTRNGIRDHEHPAYRRWNNWLADYEALTAIASKHLAKLAKGLSP